jgi:hypothetical protein
MDSISTASQGIPSVDQVWRGVSGEWAIVKACDGHFVTLSVVGSHPHAECLTTETLLSRWKLFAPWPSRSH